MHPIPQSESIAERLLESYFRGRGIAYSFESLPGKKKPDYSITTESGLVIAEAKDIGPQERTENFSFVSSLFWKRISAHPLNFPIAIEIFPPVTEQETLAFVQFVTAHRIAALPGVKTWFVDPRDAERESLVAVTIDSQEQSGRRRVVSPRSRSGRYPLQTVFSRPGFPLELGVLGNVTKRSVSLGDIATEANPRFVIEAYPQEPDIAKCTVLHNLPDAIANKIVRAAKQFSEYKTLRCPCVLVLHNNSGLPCNPDNIAEAMFGQRIYQLFYPKHLDRPSESDIITHCVGYSKKGRMFWQRDDDAAGTVRNTTISAIGVIESNERGPAIKLVHNPFARVPLPHTVFSGETDRQYEVDFSGSLKALNDV